MSKELSHTEVKAYLISETRKAVPYAQIEAALISKNTSSTSTPTEIENIKKMLRLAAQNWQQFKATQMVLNSIIMRIIDTEKIYTYNEKTKVKKFYSERALHDLFDAAGFKRLQQEFRIVYSGYNPNNNSDFLEIDDQEYLNEYMPPKWHKHYFYSGEPVPLVTEIPPNITEFLHHFIGSNELSRKWVIHWLANAIQPNSRNLVYLVAIASQGIGKGVFMTLMSHLFGPLNTAQMGNNQLEGRFNSILKNKRLINFNEIKVKTAEQDNNLKQFTEPRIMIEGKGKDAIEVDNYANIYITSNSLSSLRIDADSRRYCIIDLADAKYLQYVASKGMGPKEYQELLISEVEQFGFYLLNLKVDKDLISKPIDTKKKLESREAALTDWERCVINTICQIHAGKDLKLVEVQEMFEKHLLYKVKTTGNQFRDLQDKFPGVFEYRGKSKKKEEDGSRPSMIYILPKNKQTKYDLDEIDGEEND